jgi:hypothetical protein
VVNYVIYQNNKSAILLEQNGKASSSKRMKQVEIRYYVATDKKAKGDMSVEWCHMSQMVADFLAKPLRGKVVQMF